LISGEIFHTKERYTKTMEEIMSIICGTYGEGVTCQCIPKFLIDLIIMVTRNRLPLYHLGQAQINMLF